MKFNLLGQQGPEGQSNPDAPEAGPYIYDTPPGRGDNKGLSTVAGQVIGPANKKLHNEKLQEAGIEKEQDEKLSSLSFAEKEQPDTTLAVPNATNKEFRDIQSVEDIAELANLKRLSPTQLTILRQQFGKDAVDNALPPKTIQEETDYIRNRLSNNKNEIIEAAPKTPSGWASLNKDSTEYKMFTKQAAIEADKIIDKLAIDPASFEAKAFKAALTYGGSDAVEKLYPSITEPVPITKFEQTTSGFTENDLLNAVNNSLDNDLSDDEENDLKDDEIVDDEISDDKTTTTTGTGQITNTAFTQFNNIPENGLLWDVGGNFYIVYEVPGSQGELYEGNPIYMAYELKDNDLINAGLLTKGETAPQPNATMDQAFFDSIAIVTGNTDQLTALIDNPFASFVETVGEQAQVAPWITDPEIIALISEAAVEGREVSDAEWQTTNWYQTHNESEREWLRTYYSDPSTATQLTTDAQIAVANSLQAAGVSNAPEALINWVAGKFVSGEWSQTYTTEQISLFADPYATGKRDESFENYLSSTALTGVDRTTEREREVRELYGKWLGPSLGKLTDNEVAEIAGRLRDDPEYQDQLVQSLKQSRLAAFSNYTNPELTYEDIARPWRNLTTSVWGQTADETQGWWQDMVKSNDFAQAQTTLREKGLEQDITQVTQDATKALQGALGQGTVSQSGVNV